MLYHVFPDTHKANCYKSIAPIITVAPSKLVDFSILAATVSIRSVEQRARMNENKHEGDSEIEEEAEKRRMSCTLEEMASISSPCCLPPPSRLHIKAIGCPVNSNSTVGINIPRAMAIHARGHYRSIRFNY